MPESPFACNRNLLDIAKGRSIGLLTYRHPSFPLPAGDLPGGTKVRLLAAQGRVTRWEVRGGCGCLPCLTTHPRCGRLYAERNPLGRMRKAHLPCLVSRIHRWRGDCGMPEALGPALSRSRSSLVRLRSLFPGYLQPDLPGANQKPATPQRWAGLVRQATISRHVTRLDHGPQSALAHRVCAECIHR